MHRAMIGCMKTIIVALLLVVVGCDGSSRRGGAVDAKGDVSVDAAPVAAPLGAECTGACEETLSCTATLVGVDWVDLCSCCRPMPADPEHWECSPSPDWAAKGCTPLPPH